MGHGKGSQEEETPFFAGPIKKPAVISRLFVELGFRFLYQPWFLTKSDITGMLMYFP